MPRRSRTSAPDGDPEEEFIETTEQSEQLTGRRSFLLKGVAARERSAPDHNQASPANRTGNGPRTSSGRAPAAGGARAGVWAGPRRRSSHLEAASRVGAPGGELMGRPSAPDLVEAYARAGRPVPAGMRHEGVQPRRAAPGHRSGCMALPGACSLARPRLTTASRGRCGCTRRRACPGQWLVRPRRTANGCAGLAVVSTRGCSCAQGAQMRSCSSSVLVDETAKQVTSVHPDPLMLADEGLIGGWIRRLQLKRSVRAMPVAGSARGAVLAFRRARFPEPPSEPGVPVIPAPGSPRGPLPNKRLRWRLGSAVPSLSRSGRRYSPAAPALPTRQRSLAVPLRHVHASRVLGLLRALRHDPPPPADDAPARRTKAGRATTGRFPRSPPPGRRGRCPAIPRQPRQGYAAALPPGLLTGHYKPAAESLAATATGVHC